MSFMTFVCFSELSMYCGIELYVFTISNSYTVLKHCAKQFLCHNSHPRELRLATASHGAFSYTTSDGLEQMYLRTAVAGPFRSREAAIVSGATHCGGA